MMGGGARSLKAIVTRVSDVKPLLTIAVYTCDDCGFEIYQEVCARHRVYPFTLTQAHARRRR